MKCRDVSGILESYRKFSHIISIINKEWLNQGRSFSKQVEGAEYRYLDGTFSWAISFSNLGDVPS